MKALDLESLSSSEVQARFSGNTLIIQKDGNSVSIENQLNSNAISSFVFNDGVLDAQQMILKALADANNGTTQT